MHLYLKSYRFLDYPLRPKDLESGNCTFAILLLSKYEGTTVIKLAIGSRNINTLLVTTTEDDKMQNKTKGNHFLKFLEKKLLLWSKKVPYFVKHDIIQSNKNMKREVWQGVTPTCLPSCLLHHLHSSFSTSWVMFGTNFLHGHPIFFIFLVFLPVCEYI